MQRTCAHAVRALLRIQRDCISHRSKQRGIGDRADEHVARAVAHRLHAGADVGAARYEDDRPLARRMLSQQPLHPEAADAGQVQVDQQAARFTVVFGSQVFACRGVAEHRVAGRLERGLQLRALGCIAFDDVNGGHWAGRQISSMRY
jgi:hypothetical protein